MQLKDIKPYLLRNTTIRSISKILFTVPLIETGEEGRVAYTDGRKIWVGKEMDRYSLKEQAAIILHEIFHVILLHPSQIRQRGKHPIIWQYVCEPIVNSYITEIKEISEHVKLPDDGITFLKEPFSAALRIKSALQWTTDELYWWALENLPQSKDGILVEGHYFKDGKGARRLSLGNFKEDMVEGDDSVEGQIEEERMRQAMRDLAAGTSSSSLKQALLREIPTLDIPWHKLLQKVLQNIINSNRLIYNYARPCRHYLAGVGEYEPSVKPKPSYRIGILVDTSGSCFNPETQLLFTAVIESVRRQIRPEIVIVCGDVEAKMEQVIEATNRKPLQKVLKQFIGGGGTSYTQPMERLVSYRPNVIIGLTDGEVNQWGNPGKIPTIWVCTKETTAPYGRTIPIKNYVRP